MRETRNNQRNQTPRNQNPRSRNHHTALNTEARNGTYRSGERNRNSHKPSGTARTRNPRPEGDRRALSHEERLKLREQNIGKRKKNAKIFRVLVLGVAAVIIIALLIVILKSCTSGETSEGSASSSSVSSVNTATPTPTPTPPPADTGINTGSDLLDTLWAEAIKEEAELEAKEAEKLRQEEEAKLLANTPTEEYAKEKSLEGKSISEKDSMLIIGDSAYPYYKFNYEATNKFAEALNKAPKGINVYSVIAPSKIDIELPLSLLDDYPNQTSDQRKAIRYANSLLDERINKVYVYDRLKAHCDEDLYFKGDSRSTSLASYYAYTSWAEAKGITPVKLEDLTEVTYSYFRGNLSSLNGAICSSEDITLYKSGTNFSFKNRVNSSMENWSVYVNVADYAAPYKYSTFLMDSNEYGVITNNDIEGDSACIIVKDASGNTFAPFVAEHYKTTYVVDYRNYKGSLESLINETEAVDLIYFIPIENVNSESAAAKISDIS